MFKKVFLSFMLALTIFASSLFFGGVSVLQAETESVKQEITYVALGDSISKGYYINFKRSIDDEENTYPSNVITGKESAYEPIEGSYVDKIRDKLEKTYTGAVNAYNYSITGDDCQDLLNFIKGGDERTGFYDADSKQAKNATSNNEIFTGLKNEEVLNSLNNAKVISVCIGANNILSQSISLMTGFLNDGSITVKDMEATLKKQIVGDADNNIKGFKAEFEELLTTLTDINSTAKIYFSNVYNPYKVLTGPSSLSIIQMLYPNFTQDNLNIVSEVAELAIAGGKDSAEEDFIGINNVIEDAISESNNDNFIYVDTKALFDEKYDENNKKNYLTYVNVCLNELKIGFSTTENDVYACFDPHPTYAGHELIFNAHNKKGVDLDAAKQLYVTFDTNCNDVANTKGEVIDGKVIMPNISRNKYKLVGWFKDEACTEGNEWDFETDVVTEDITLYAKWERTHYSVVLNFNGGTFNGASSSEILIEVGGKINISKNPEKQNHEFVGWFKDEACTEGNEWDFETDVVTEDITLYAKWEKNVFSVNFDFDGGLISGQNSKTFNVKKGQKLTQENVEYVNNVKKDGYIFEYWFISDKNEEVDLLTYVVEQDIVVYAKWVEAITIEIYNLSNRVVSHTLKKGALIEDLYTIVQLESYDRPFLGWFKSNGSNAIEFNNKQELENKVKIYAKWVEITCLTDDLRDQKFSPITKAVEFEVNAKEGFVVCWQVDGKVEKEVTITDANSKKWSFKPQEVDSYEISCKVKNNITSEKTASGTTTVTLRYSVPNQKISFSLVEVNEKTYTFEVDNAQYYDSDKFYWFVTKDAISTDFSELVGTGSTLKYTFSNDCKICVKYMENADAPATIISDAESVEIEFGVNYTAIIVTSVVVIVSALVILFVVLYKRRYQNFY